MDKPGPTRCESWSAALLSVFGIMSWSYNESAFWFHVASKQRYAYRFTDEFGNEYEAPP